MNENCHVFCWLLCWIELFILRSPRYPHDCDLLVLWGIIPPPAPFKEAVQKLLWMKITLWIEEVDISYATCPPFIEQFSLSRAAKIGGEGQTGHHSKHFWWVPVIGGVSCNNPCTTGGSLVAVFTGKRKVEFKEQSTTWDTRHSCKCSPWCWFMLQKKNVITKL